MIARRVVELHGGTLKVRSEVGVGTRFVLSLPVEAPAAEAPAAPKPRRRRRRFGKAEPRPAPERTPQEDESQPIGF
jgi:hypothetical protein